MSDVPPQESRPLGAVVADLRAAFLEVLQAAGPTAPTLCEGWTAHDLAAHVVARERRPLADAGLVVPALAGWTERTRLPTARHSFPNLLEQVREGPGRFSPFSLPGVEGLANLVEFTVHLQDAARPAGVVVPQVAGLERAVVGQLRRQAPLHRRRLPGPVVLRTADGERMWDVPPSPEPVVVTGPPVELLLFLTGRSAARVEIEGPAEAVARVRAASLGL
ncbi:MAG: TIGR03085 family metal-binding protein [Kineosporiaceae bacterium]